MKRRAQTLMRLLRYQRDLTLDEVHVATTIDPGLMSRIERRLTTATATQQKQLARFYGVPYRALIADAPRLEGAPEIWRSAEE